MLDSQKMRIRRIVLSVDLPVPLNAQPKYFADIGDEVVVELFLRFFDADPIHEFGNNIEAPVRQIEVIRRPSYLRPKLLNQHV